MTAIPSMEHLQSPSPYLRKALRGLLWMYTGLSMRSAQGTSMTMSFLPSQSITLRSLLERRFALTNSRLSRRSQMFPIFPSASGTPSTLRPSSHSFRPRTTPHHLAQAMAESKNHSAGSHDFRQDSIKTIGFSKDQNRGAEVVFNIRTINIIIRYYYNIIQNRHNYIHQFYSCIHELSDIR